MLPQQRQYQEDVQITQGGEEYNGTYSTDTNEREQAYTYYLDGNRKANKIHFTVVETGSGNAPLSKFHITVPLQREGSTGIANLHINYERQWNGTVGRDTTFPRKRSDLRVPPFTGTTIDEVSEIYQSTAKQYLSKNNATLNNVAQEFANDVWR